MKKALIWVFALGLIGGLSVTIARSNDKAGKFKFQYAAKFVCGQAELDELLVERERINSRIQEILDAQTDPWGIKVVLVELKHIDLPQEMQRAMAKQAEAERERRAKVIHAEGEFQASQKLADAAVVMGKQPMSLQLRFLQSLVEVASEKNHTTIVPIPIDLLAPFLKKTDTSET